MLKILSDKICSFKAFFFDREKVRGIYYSLGNQTKIDFNINFE